MAKSNLYTSSFVWDGRSKIQLMSFESGLPHGVATRGDDVSESVLLAHQIELTENGPYALIRVLTIEPSKGGDLIAALNLDAEFNKQKTSYISTKLRKAIGSSPASTKFEIRKIVETFPTR